MCKSKTNANKSDMVQVSTCKHEFTSNGAKAKKRLKQNTSNFARIFSAVVKNFLAFAKYFLGLW